MSTWFLIGMACALAVVIALLLLRGGNRRNADEMALDDMEQVAAVSKPAPLNPHVRANTAYGKEIV